MNKTIEEAVAVLAVASLPDVHWLEGDGLCDCAFQRVGEWTNPYLGQTLRVRLCCIWKELYKQYPQFVQEIPAAYDVNRHQWRTEPQPWDSLTQAMPVPLWHRQLARQQGRSLEEIRTLYKGREHERPGPVQHPRVDAPAVLEVRHGHEERLRAAGWLLPGERWNELPTSQELQRQRMEEYERYAG